MAPSSLVRAAWSALRPTAGADLARLRRSAVALDRAVPGAASIAVVGLGEAVGASTLAALLTQRLARLGPGRAGLLDCDPTGGGQRARLGVPADAPRLGPRDVLADPAAHRQRRRLDAYLLRGVVPVLAGYPDRDPSPLSDTELGVVLGALRHRFPLVVVDAPYTPDERYLAWATASCDCVLAVVPRGSTAVSAVQDLAERDDRVVPVLSSVGRPAEVLRALRDHPSEDPVATLRWDDQPALHGTGPVLLPMLPARTQLAVDVVTTRVARDWPRR